MAKEKQDRSAYQREQYSINQDKRKEQRTSWNDDKSLAVSYFKQKEFFNRDIPQLIANVSDEIIEIARIEVEVLAKQYA